MSNKEEKVETSPSFSISSLPDELVISCLARISRYEYAALSRVSKRFGSLVVSPDLYKTRSLLGRREECLYVCLRTDLDSTPHWFILSHEKALSPIPSFLSQPLSGSSVVALDWGIYVIGGFILGKPTSDVLLLDCRTHRWRHVPSMRVPRAWAAASVVGGKIYVFGGYEVDNDSLSYGEVFEPKTKTWDNLMTMPDRDIHLKWIDQSLVIEEKVYALENRWDNVTNKSRTHILYYSPCECKWGRKVHGSKPYIRSDCVMIDKLGFCYNREGKFFWCEPDKFIWKKVKGLNIRKLFGSVSLVYNLISNFGEKNIVVFWRVGEAKCSKISCAEILFERHEDGDEILGRVEWSGALSTLDHHVTHFDRVLYYVSLNL